MFRTDLRPPQSSEVSCSCGAVLSVRAFTFTERQGLIQRFLDAHADCRAPAKTNMEARDAD